MYVFGEIMSYLAIILLFPRYLDKYQRNNLTRLFLKDISRPCHQYQLFKDEFSIGRRFEFTGHNFTIHVF